MQSPIFGDQNVVIFLYASQFFPAQYFRLPTCFLLLFGVSLRQLDGWLAFFKKIPRDLLGSLTKDFYLQVSGTSMGSIMAPNYANLFMGHYEHKYVSNPDVNTHCNKILSWFRYIDDVFCIFKGNPAEAQEFVASLNDFDQNIKFTLEASYNKVHFLDMWIMKINGSLSTTLYQKETDRNMLLLSTSLHPSPLKNLYLSANSTG